MLATFHRRAGAKYEVTILREHSRAGGRLEDMGGISDEQGGTAAASNQLRLYEVRHIQGVRRRR